MLEYLTSEKPAVSRVLGGLVFSGGVSEDGKSLTGKVQYKVRLRAGQFANVGRGRINILLTSDWYTELMFPLRPGIKPRNNGSARGGSPSESLHFHPYWSYFFNFFFLFSQRVHQGNPLVFLRLIGMVSLISPILDFENRPFFIYTLLKKT